MIRDRTSSVAAEFSQALHFEKMLPFARNTAPPLVGIQVTYSGGQVVERYVKLNADGNIRYDFDIEVSGLGDLPPQRMLFKNTAPVRAHDQAMRLANGAVLIRHLNRLFILAAKPK